MRICLVTSSGGHLFHLFLLKKWWINYERFWVASKKEDAVSLLSKEHVYWAHYPTPRNVKNLVRNIFLAVRILIKERPTLIVSTGAAVAVPFFYIGKLFGSKLVFIEVYDRIDTPSLTGKLVYYITDLFVIQWKEQKRFYPKGINLGELL